MQRQLTARSTIVSTIVPKTVLTIASLALFAASATALADAKLDSVREKISGMFDEIDPENVDVSGIDGWYKVQKGGIVAYVSDDGRYLME